MLHEKWMGSDLLVLMSFLFQYSSPTCCFRVSDTSVSESLTPGQASHQCKTNLGSPGGTAGPSPPRISGMSAQEVSQQAQQSCLGAHRLSWHLSE